MERKRALVIVDIQEEFGEWISYKYLKGILEFMRNNHMKYDRVISLVEPHRSYKLESDKIPKFIGSCLTEEPIYKIYDSRHTNNIMYINKTNWTDVENDLDRHKKEINYGIHMSNYKLIKLEYKRDTDNKIQKNIITLTKRHEKLIQSLKNYEVDIIGGGLTRCVMTTDLIFKKYGVNSKVLKKHCYNILDIDGDHKNIFKRKARCDYDNNIAINGEWLMSRVDIKNGEMYGN